MSESPLLATYILSHPANISIMYTSFFFRLDDADDADDVENDVYDYESDRCSLLVVAFDPDRA